MKFQRDFYYPKGSTLEEHTSPVALIARYDRGGKLCVAVFGAKRAKPDHHFIFKSEDHRERFIAEYLDKLRVGEESMAKRKVERRSFRHTLQVGDILRNSWGYDQTNIDYYEVTAILGACMVEIREIGQESEETAYMQGRCIPVPGRYIGKPMRKKVCQGNTIKIHSWGSWASLLDFETVAGSKIYRESHWTAYA